jgi:hypothetical protein
MATESIDLPHKWKIQRIYNFKSVSDPKTSACDMSLNQEEIKLNVYEL